ncbi:hypothetical protein [Pseudovibrio sp. SCP19]|uniref:hypothetical protein n=1 Tax=Pseudovibrio sp. SCP19 TaxID=3141374 RepID=UPI003334C6EC
MISWFIDRVVTLGEWIGKDIRRVHVMMAVFDLVGIWATWFFLSTTITALYAPEIQPDLLTILRGKNSWALAGLSIPLCHLAITPWGQYWIKRSIKSFSITFLTVAVGGAFLGIAITDYARGQAVLAGYQSCDRTFLHDFQRENEILVAPGVLCPPTSSNGKPYPPPD